MSKFACSSRFVTIGRPIAPLVLSTHELQRRSADVDFFFLLPLIFSSPAFHGSCARQGASLCMRARCLGQAHQLYTNHMEVGSRRCAASFAALCSWLGWARCRRP